MQITNVVILGAGTMGSQIAAHLANVGLSCSLLDIVPEGARGDDRSRVARDAVSRMQGSSRSPFTSVRNAGNIRVGNIEDHAALLGQADWIVEAVAESIDIKKSVHSLIDGLRRPDAIVTTNTSGLSIAALAEDRSDGFRRHLFGAHFFNPPRLMHLLEVVPSVDTDSATLGDFVAFATDILGKGVVRCKDTPNFIGNRIGIFAITAAIHLAVEEGFTLAEADALTGLAIGRPRTGTFRLADLIGLDVLANVARTNVRAESQSESGSEWLKFAEVPQCLQRLVDEGKLGDKTRSGFYRKQGDAHQSLNLISFEYEPAGKSIGAVDAVRRIAPPAERWATLMEQLDEQHLRYARRCLLLPLQYAATRATKIADDIVSIDRAMRWGYNWELGPFEWWDALGVGNVADHLVAEGWETPTLVSRVLAAENPAFLTQGMGFPLLEGQQSTPLTDDREITTARLRNVNAALEHNEDASLVDLGKGVACLEFHSKMNIINRGTLDLLERSADRVASGFAGLVVGNNADHFCVGMNLVEFHQEAEAADWESIDQKLNRLQQACRGLYRSAFPVVTAPVGLALGGGCEIVFGGNRVLAGSETSIGLVEVNVGLIPAGGGTCERVARALRDVEPSDPEAIARLIAVFDLIFDARASTSAHEAKELGYLRSDDVVSFHPRHRLHQAAELVRTMADGFAQPDVRKILALGRAGQNALQSHIDERRSTDELTNHDTIVAGELMRVLCGGDGTSPEVVDDQIFLDLEREAFLKLCGYPQTRDRIGHMLKTGKPLKN